MKGWEFVYTNKPLRLVEKPDPVAKPGDVVVEVKSCGLCHSDVSAMEDEGWLNIVKVPIILGHEYAGIITEIGEGVTGFKVGDRVGVFSTSQREGTPPEWDAPGYERDGGYATKAAMRAENLIKIPEDVNFAQAAVGTDAGVTAYHAVAIRGAVKPGMKVGIIGIGGLGQIGARVAVVKGCEVYAVDVKEDARALALSLGCRAAVSTVEELAQYGLDVIVDYAGTGGTTAAAVEAVKPKGRVVIVGLASLETTVNTMTMILKEVDLVGSVSGTLPDLADVYDLMASGALQPQYEVTEFAKIPEGLERLKTGTVKGRLVAIRD